MYPILLDLGFWQLRSYGVLVAVLYGAVRFAMEFFRGDPPMVAGVIVPQAVSVVLVLAAAANVLLLRRTVWRVNQPAVG